MGFPVLKIQAFPEENVVYFHHGDSNNHPMHTVRHSIKSAHDSDFIEFEDDLHVQHVMSELFGFDSDEYPLFEGNSFDDSLSHCVDLKHFQFCVNGRNLSLDSEILEISFDQWCESFMPFLKTTDINDDQLVVASNYGSSNVWSELIDDSGVKTLSLGINENASSFYITDRSYPVSCKSIRLVSF